MAGTSENISDFDQLNNFIFLLSTKTEELTNTGKNLQQTYSHLTNQTFQPGQETVSFSSVCEQLLPGVLDSLTTNPAKKQEQQDEIKLVDFEQFGAYIHKLNSQVTEIRNTIHRLKQVYARCISKQNEPFVSKSLSELGKPLLSGNEDNSSSKNENDSEGEME